MKKASPFILVAALAIAACAQGSLRRGGSGLLSSSGAPTGACAGAQADVDTTTGNFYSCNGGAWVKVGPGASVPTTIPVSAQTASYSVAAGDFSAGKIITVNDASAATVTLLATAPAGGQYIYVENIGAGAVTVANNARNIDGAASSLTLNQNQGVLIVSDGTNYVTNRGIGGAGGSTTNAATQYSLPYYSAAGSASTLSGITAPTTNGHYFYGFNVTGGAAVTPTIQQSGLAAGTVNGATTTYTFAAGDEGTFVVHDKAATGAVTITLPTPATLGNTNYDAGWCNDSAQTDVLTPTTYTIAVGNGAAAATASIAPGECMRVMVDPHNASQWIGVPSFTTSGSSAFSGLTGGTNTTAAMILGTGASLTTSGTGTNTANQLSFGATTIANSGTAPTSGQCLEYNGTNLGGAACSGSATAPTLSVANATATGTTANTLTKLTGAPSTAVIAATTDTGGVVGITTAGAGIAPTVPTATITYAGSVNCVFDGATTAGDYVQISSTTAGDCKDAGATYPTSGQVVGRVLSTNAAAGTYGIDLYPSEIKAAAAATTPVNFFTPRDRSFELYVVNDGHSRDDEIGFSNTTTGTAAFSLSNLDAKGNQYETIASGTVANTNDGVYASVGKIAIPGIAYSFQAVAGLSTTTSVNAWVALASAPSPSDAATVDLGTSTVAVVGFRYFSGTDTSGHWQCFISEGTGSLAGQVIDSGVAVDTTNLQTFDAFATSGGAISFYINGTAVCGSPVTPTNAPNLNMAPMVIFENTTTTSVTMKIAKIYVGVS